METLKTIRNKMYSWVIGKGLTLYDKDREEIKLIMEEYRNLTEPEKSEEVKWKPYPESA